MKGAEATSKTVDVFDICGDLQAINVTLVFTTTEKNLMKGGKVDDSLLKSFDSPSNFELTLGAWSMREKLLNLMYLLSKASPYSAIKSY